MDQLKSLAILFLFMSLSWSSELSDLSDEELVNEESKKILLKTKKYHPGKHFDCDLVLQSQQEQMLYPSASGPKVVVSFDSYQWPKNKEGHVIVPYHISRGSGYTTEEVNLMRRSMDAVESETCIRFRPRRHESDFVNIFSGQFCKSNLGRTGGGQEMSLNRKRCMDKGIIQHELLHALGYIHMHNRPDRDKYVNILWKNIEPRWYKEFAKVNPAIFTSVGTAYDYHSIMHYGSGGFSKNGGKTIVTNNGAYDDVIGQRNGLSDGDIRRINNRYNCQTGGGGGSYGGSIFSNSFEHHSHYEPKTRFVDHSSVFQPGYSSGFQPVVLPSYRQHKGLGSYATTKDIKDIDVDELFNI